VTLNPPKKSAGIFSWKTASRAFAAVKLCILFKGGEMAAGKKGADSKPKKATKKVAKPAKKTGKSK
jgi:hypothetical protein